MQVIDAGHYDNRNPFSHANSVGGKSYTMLEVEHNASECKIQISARARKCADPECVLFTKRRTQLRRRPGAFWQRILAPVLPTCSRTTKNKGMKWAFIWQTLAEWKRTSSRWSRNCWKRTRKTRMDWKAPQEELLVASSYEESDDSEPAMEEADGGGCRRGSERHQSDRGGPENRQEGKDKQQASQGCCVRSPNVEKKAQTC